MKQKLHPTRTSASLFAAALLLATFSAQFSTLFAQGGKAGNFGNTATGDHALYSDTSGSANTANGFSALSSNTTGTNNTADGKEALASNMTGINNTAVGVAALPQNTSGGGNIALGYLAGFGVATADNVIAIGADGADVEHAHVRPDAGFAHAYVGGDRERLQTSVFRRQQEPKPGA